MAVNTLTLGNALDGSFANFPPDSAIGIVPFWGSHEFGAHSEFTVADDAILLCQFPENTHLILRGVEDFAITVTDMETGTALEFDVGIGSAAGEIATELIGTTDVGQAGGTDLLDADNVVPHFLDVSGLYLIMKVTTAATTDAFVGEEVSFSGLCTRNVSKAVKQPVSH